MIHNDMNQNGAKPPSKGARSGYKKPNMAAVSVYLFVSAQNRPTSLLGWFSLSVSGLVLGRADQGRKQGKAPSTFCHPPAGWTGSHTQIWLGICTGKVCKNFETSDSSIKPLKTAKKRTTCLLALRAPSRSDSSLLLAPAGRLFQTERRDKDGRGRGGRGERCVQNCTCGISLLICGLWFEYRVRQRSLPASAQVIRIAHMT